jgi:hypothetical protein
VLWVHSYLLIYLLTPWSRDFLEKLARNSPHFMETEGSLPPPASILSQLNPVHTCPSFVAQAVCEYFVKNMRFNREEFSAPRTTPS